MKNWFKASIGLMLTCGLSGIVLSKPQGSVFPNSPLPQETIQFQSESARNLIRFLPESEVIGSILVLGDIAEISGPDAKELSKLRIGETAGFGLSKLIDIDRILQGVLQPWSERIRIEGSSGMLKVKTKADTLPDSQIDSMLQDLMRKQAWKQGTEWKAKWIKKPLHIEIPIGHPTHELQFSGQKRIGKIPLELKISNKDGLARRVPFIAEITVDAPVAIATSLIHRGEIISESFFKTERRDITRFIDGTIPEPAKCIGRVAKVTIQPGRVLTLNVLDIPATVKRGDRVPLIFEQGLVKVAVDAVARRDGRIGEIIPAFSALKGKVIRGEVREDGGLTWLPEGS